MGGNLPTSKDYPITTLLQLPLVTYQILDFDQNESTSLILLGGKNITPTLYGTGRNEYGQLAVDPTVYSSFNHWISVYTSTSGIQITAISESGYSTYFIVDSHFYLSDWSILYAVGRNDQGQLGNGHSISTSEIQKIITAKNELSNLESAEADVTLLESNEFFTDYLGWGDNEVGQLGIKTNTQIFYNTPQVLLDITDRNQHITNTSLSSSNTMYVLESDNLSLGTAVQEVYVAGSNEYGQFGNESQSDEVVVEQSPTLVGVITPSNPTSLNLSNSNIMFVENYSVKFTSRYI